MIDTLFIGKALSLVRAAIRTIAVLVVLMRLTMRSRSIVSVRDVAERSAVACLFANQVDHAVCAVEHRERILSERLIIDRC